jgi:hypothetical protein
MANETTLVASLSNTEAESAFLKAVSLSITQAGTANFANVQTLSTTTAAISLGGVTSPGVYHVQKSGRDCHDFNRADYASHHWTGECIFHAASR